MSQETALLQISRLSLILSNEFGFRPFPLLQHFAPFYSILLPFTYAHAAYSLYILWSTCLHTFPVHPGIQLLSLWQAALKGRRHLELRLR